MDRRDFFRRVAGVIAAGVGAVLLPRSAQGEVRCLAVSEVKPLAPVMGEQAHWPAEER